MGILDNWREVASEARQALSYLASQGQGQRPQGSGQASAFGNVNATPQPTQLNGEVTQAVLNGSGNARINISPGQPGAPGSGVGSARNSGLSWDLSSVTISANPAGANPGVVTTATVAVYVSWGIFPASPNPADLIANGNLFPTSAGPSSVNCVMAPNLRPGDWIIVVITGGDPGATVSARVWGTVNPPGA
jgi:hypothetical protein